MAGDDILKYFLSKFGRKIILNIACEVVLLGDISHEVPSPTLYLLEKENNNIIINLS